MLKSIFSLIVFSLISYRSYTLPIEELLNLTEIVKEDDYDVLYFNTECEYKLWFINEYIHLLVKKCGDHPAYKSVTYSLFQEDEIIYMKKELLQYADQKWVNNDIEFLYFKTPKILKSEKKYFFSITDNDYSKHSQ